MILSSCSFFFVSYSVGLQPRSNGLQPTSDGLLVPWCRERFVRRGTGCALDELS